MMQHKKHRYAPGGEAASELGGRPGRASLLPMTTLKGREKGRWSIWVNGSWRLTFEFRDGDAYVLDYEDYH